MNRLPTQAAQRCLFLNDCVQAHLLGLDRRCPCFEACDSDQTTVIITFGSADAFLDGQAVKLRTGDQVNVPAACPMRLVTQTEADVLLLRSSSVG
jgi:hypothetical protein